ncbi:hypothetical protein EG68_12627, partial [Paragonimus skrjabini miyazakii]
MLSNLPKEDFQKVVHLNVRMREELHSMRLEVNALRFTLAESPAKLSDDFPVQFPLNSVEDVQLLNKQLEDRGLYLKMTDYVNQIGGRTMGNCARNIMDTVMTDELATNINWRGVNNKFSFAPTALSQLVCIRCYHAAEFPWFVAQGRKRENPEVDPESQRTVCAAVEEQIAHGCTGRGQGESI